MKRKFTILGVTFMVACAAGLFLKTHLKVENELLMANVEALTQDENKPDVPQEPKDYEKIVSSTTQTTYRYRDPRTNILYDVSGVATVIDFCLGKGDLKCVSGVLVGFVESSRIRIYEV